MIRCFRIKITKTVLVLTCCLLSFTIAFSQVLQGSILDQDSSTPVSFANIAIEGTPYGTTSNEEGKFVLNTSKFGDNFTLLISCLAYKTKKIQLSNPKVEDTITINLERNVLELQEIVVSYLSAEEIMNRFYAHHSKNYPKLSLRSKAFYHTTLSENGEYKRYLDATIDLREYSTKKSRAFEVEITQRRMSNDYRTERWGERNNYLYEAIASNPLYQLSDFLDSKNFKYYDIKRLENTTYDNHLVYVLEFNPKKDASKPLYHATAYINANDYALVKADYSFKNDHQKIKDQKLKEKTYHIPFISGNIQYEKIGDFYKQKYLSYCNGLTIYNNITGDTIAKDILKDEILFSETKLSEKELLNPLPKWGDIYKRPFPYHPEYWDQLTKIPQTALTRKAINDLEKYQKIEVQYFNNSSDRLLSQNFEPTINGKMDSLLSVYHLTGLFNGVVLIKNGDEMILHKAYGFNDLEGTAPLDTSFLFDIGSITKQFTAVMILKLKDEHKLKLEDKLGVYLPNHRYAQDLTIHQLMAHRTGIPSFDYLDKWNQASWFTDDITTEDFIHSYCSGDLVFQPDTEMEYSNSNYLILTAIIEKITRMDYYSALQEYLFDPLLLKNSYPPNQIPSTEAVAKGYILGGKNYVDEPDWKKSNMKGVGCIYSTASDLLQWTESFTSDQFLSEENLELMMSPLSYYEYYNANFGYSWGINKTLLDSKKPTYFYGGTSLGFFSMLTVIPESDTHIILINNKGDFPRIELTNEVLKLLR